MSDKGRVSPSVDEDLPAGQAAVAAGRAEVSASVNDALRLRAAHELRLAALDAFVGEYESEHGEITAEEMDAAGRRARARSVALGCSPKAGC